MAGPMPGPGASSGMLSASDGTIQERRTNRHWVDDTERIVADAQRSKGLSTMLRDESEQLKQMDRKASRNADAKVNDSLKIKVQDTQLLVRRLQTQLKDLTTEMERLEQMRERVVLKCYGRRRLLEVSLTQTDARAKRPERENVVDRVHDALQAESADLKCTIEQLIALTKAATTHLQRMRSVRSELSADLKDKVQSLDLDKQCLSVQYTPPPAGAAYDHMEAADESMDGLGSVSGGTPRLPDVGASSMGPHPPPSDASGSYAFRRMNTVAGSPPASVLLSSSVASIVGSRPPVVYPEEWKRDTLVKIQEATEFTQTSVKMRSIATKVLRTVEESNTNHNLNVTTALKAKIRQTSKLQDKLTKQMEEINEEMARVEKEKSKVLAERDAKKEPLNVVQQRLAIRQRRPHREAVRDVAEEALEEQLHSLQESAFNYARKYEELTNEQQRLLLSKNFVEDNLEDKAVTLRLHTKCLELHAEPPELPGTSASARKAKDVTTESPKPTPASPRSTVGQQPQPPPPGSGVPFSTTKSLTQTKRNAMLLQQEIAALLYTKPPRPTPLNQKESPLTAGVKLKSAGRTARPPPTRLPPAFA